MMTQLVLLDRDGTIIKEKHYLSSPDDVELLPMAAEGIRLLTDLGLKVAVVTNQSGVSRGYFDIETVKRVNRRLGELLSEERVCLNGFFVCPHHPEDRCDCRKPNPGLAYQASAELCVSLQGSFVIGDKECDIELGKNIKATTVLVRTGYGNSLAKEGSIDADYIVDNLFEASNTIRDLIRKRSNVKVDTP